MKPPRGVFEKPKGSGIWWINYYDSDGKRHREKIGRQSVAIDAFLHRRTEVREGKFAAPRGSKLKFRELADLSLDDKKLRLSPRSWYTDKARLVTLKEAFGELPAANITSARIEEFLARLRTKEHHGNKRTGATANRYRTLISSIFSFGIRAGKVRLNPVARVRRFRESEHRIRFLEVEEEKSVREVVRVSEAHEAEMDLALNTGIRRGEQYGLKWENVDLERGILTVTGKTGRRFVPINSAARAAIEKLYLISNGSPYVCPDKLRDDQVDWRTWFAEACETAKIDNFRWHDLRHTFASRLVMVGVDLSTVQKLLGHRSIVTTQRYAHLSPSHERAAVDRLVPAAPAGTEAQNDGHSNGTNGRTGTKTLMQVSRPQPIARKSSG
ncbi:MAG TPA: tyrosine-type recombinase/integrase [Candidatus Acidoferrales bacterium]